MITVTAPASSRWLTSVERVQQELGLASLTPSQRDRIEGLIETISNDVAEYCGREFVREGVTEAMTGYGRTVLALTRTPLAFVSDVRFRGASIPASGYDGWSIYNAGAGFLYKASGFISSEAIAIGITPRFANTPGELAWQADYIGGYLTRADDVETAALTLTASGNCYRLLNEEQEWPLVCSGEYVSVAGFTNFRNNRKHRVLARTASELTVAESLVEETPDAICHVYVHNLPAGLEMAVLDIITRQYLNTGRDRDVQSERIGDWSATYGGDGGMVDAHGFTKSECTRLDRFVRVGQA